MSDPFCPLIQGTIKKQPKQFAKLLTLIEKSGISSLQQKELLQPQTQSFRLGITGPPGAGKSTFINQLIGLLRKSNLTVGVLAVDPSSPLTGGAVLGDRIRYIDHFLDEGVFIRSLGTRGSLGGLCASSYLMLRAFDLYHFDIVIVETVGVGQSELDIVNVADHVSILLVPESGDSIQMMKCGLLEVGHSFVINKSDRPGAEALSKELQSELFQSEKSKDKPIFMATSTSGEGVEEYFNQIIKKRTETLNRNSKDRLQKEGRALLQSSFESYWDKASQSVTNISQLCETIEHFQNKLRDA